MKKVILLLVFLAPFLAFSQECVMVDTVYNTAKLRELGNRDIRFGVKQIAEEELSNKYCLMPNGKPVKVEIYYFGVPKKSIRVVGVERTDQITQVGVRFYYDDKVYSGVGESETSVKATFIELADGKVPFSKMTVSSAIKKAIQECVSQMP